MPFCIRPAAPGELPELWLRLSGMDPWHTLEISAEQLEAAALTDPLRQTLVCTNGSAIAGLISFRAHSALDYLARLPGAHALVSAQASSGTTSLDGGYVNLLAVFPGFQGLSIGPRLLEAAADNARRAGSQRIYLCVSGFNTAARRFYERYGFHQIGILDNCIRPGNREHLLVLSFLPG